MVVGSYPLSSQAPTPVEVELGCDNYGAEIWPRQIFNVDILFAPHFNLIFIQISIFFLYFKTYLYAFIVNVLLKPKAFLFLNIFPEQKCS